jgi:hypothetical protein
MPDITSRNLEAALINQKAAGFFRGKAYVFVATFHEGECILGVAVANEQGFHPIVGKVFESYDTAKQWAHELNEHIGRSNDEVLDIVTSTMGGARVVLQ